MDISPDPSKDSLTQVYTDNFNTAKANPSISDTANKMNTSLDPSKDSLLPDDTIKLFPGVNPFTPTKTISVFNTDPKKRERPIYPDDNKNVSLKKQIKVDPLPDDTIKLFPGVKPSNPTENISVFNIPRSLDRPNPDDTIYNRIKNMQTVKEMVNIVKEKFYQGYHPLIVKKKFDDLKKYVTDSFNSEENLTALEKFDYMNLIFPLRIGIHFDIRAFTNYIGMTFKIILNPFSPINDTCCYIEIGSHGSMVIKNGFTVDIIIPRKRELNVWMTRTSQITNYSFAWFSQDIRIHCPLDSEDKFKNCFYRKATDFQKFSLNAIENPKSKQPKDYDINLSKRPLLFGEPNPNIYDKNLKATKNYDETDPYNMHGVFIHYNTCGFCPGMDLLKTTEFKLFMRSGCVSLNEYVKNYIPEINEGIEPNRYYTFIDNVYLLCECYDNELNDRELTIFLNRIVNMINEKKIKPFFSNFEPYEIDTFLSASKFVVVKYLLSDVINFFIKINLNRLIILDKSCSSIQENLDVRSLRRVRRGGMSKKQRSKTQKRKKNKTRRNKK